MADTLCFHIDSVSTWRQVVYSKAPRPPAASFRIRGLLEGIAEIAFLSIKVTRVG